MRIAIICKTFLKGGAEKQALILAKLLADKGIDIILINLAGNQVDPGNLRYIEENSFRNFALKGLYLARILKLQKLLREEKISIIVSYLTLSNFASGIIKIFNRKMIIIGGIRNEKLPYFKFLFEKLMHNYLNDATVFNNFSAKDKFIRRGFNPEKIHVIQNAIECNSFLPDSKISNGEIKIISVGRFVRQKDYPTALISFRNLVDKRKDISFIYYIVGYGPLEHEIRSMARRLKIDQNIKFFINPANIYEILRSCDIFLSTSLFEGVSNSIMEAMAAGLPIIATDVGDNRHLVRDGSNGYLVPSRDVNRIVEKLDYLAGSEAIRKELGKSSHSIIQNDFSKFKLLDNYLSLLSLWQ